MDLEADVEIKDNDGLTALIHAAHIGHEAVVCWCKKLQQWEILSTSLY